MAPERRAGSRELDDSRVCATTTAPPAGAADDARRGRPGSTVASRQLAHDYPESEKDDRGQVLRSGRDAGPEQFLIGAIAILQGGELASCCWRLGNTANLMLARASARLVARSGVPGTLGRRTVERVSLLPHRNLMLRRGGAQQLGAAIEILWATGTPCRAVAVIGAVPSNPDRRQRRDAGFTLGIGCCAASFRCRGRPRSGARRIAGRLASGGGAHRRVRKRCAKGDGELEVGLAMVVC